MTGKYVRTGPGAAGVIMTPLPHAPYAENVRSTKGSAAQGASTADCEEVLLETVDRLFYERGFQSVSMDEVRDASGIPLKRIYACFPSKNHLVEAYLKRRDERWRDGFERYVTSRSEDPSTQLLLVFDAVEAWVRSTAQFRGCAFHNAFGELAGTSQFASTIVRAHKHHVRHFLERTASRAGIRRPKQVAAQLMLLVEGALITSAIDDDPAPIRVAKAAARVLLDAATRANPRREAR
jgi:AcrR family transcriptional regulator